MTNVKHSIFLITIILTIFSCQEMEKVEETLAEKDSRIQVFNMGTFHFDYTSDAMSTEFDEEDSQNLKEIDELNQRIAEFKPTVILVESVPEKNAELQTEYEAFKASDKKHSNYRGEIGLVAFDVGRRANVSRIYGIDNTMYYNFLIGKDMIEEHPNETYSSFVRRMDKEYSRTEAFNKSTLTEKMIYYNSQEYIDHMIKLNADILTYVSSDSLNEGADEAAKFYNRNLRIFSNVHKINLNKNDRVFILMGAAHSSFLQGFFKRSDDYSLVDIPSFLNSQ